MIDETANSAESDALMFEPAGDRPGRQDVGAVCGWQEAVECVIRLAEQLHQFHLDDQIHGRIGQRRVEHGGNRERSYTLADAVLGLPAVFGDDVAAAAPESLQTAQATDPRMDIYGLGMALYQLLCGRAPFRSQNASELQRQVCEDPPQPPRQLVHSIPAQIETICLKALAKLPSERFQSAAQVADALSEAFEQDDSGSLSRFRLSPSKAARVAPHRVILFVDFKARNVESAVQVEEDSVLPASLFRQLAVDCLPAGVTEPLDWSATSGLFRVTLPPQEDVTKVAVGTCLRFASRLTDSMAPHGVLGMLGKRIHVRVGVAEPTDGDTRQASLENFPVRRTSLQLSVQHDRIESSRRGLEVIERWYPCTEFDRSRMRVIAGSEIPNLELVLSEATAPIRLHGRDAQLSILQARWTQACDGLGQAVLIIGEPGSGKTRLVHELIRLGTQSPPESYVVQWNCLPTLSGQALQSAVNWFQTSLDLSPAMDGARCRQRLSEHLANHGIESPDIADALAQLVGAGSPSRQRARTQTEQKQLIQEGLLQWLKAVARHSPLLFIVEDLHWVDPTTLEFVTRVIEQGLTDRLLTVFTLRPEFETPWGSRAHQTQLALGRLRRSHVASVLASSGVSDEFLDRAMAETRGVPAAVEEFAWRFGRCG